VLLVSVHALWQAIDGEDSTMARISLVTGARSGKSAIAEGLALGPTGRATYIATSQAFDAEMEQRIALHRARRGVEWDLVEAPLDLAGALRDRDDQPCLVDCLTLWLTNLMMADRDWRLETPEVLAALRARKAPVVLVTNEVGGGSCPTMRWPDPFAMLRACSISRWGPWPTM
jgi:adenosylcobinamide kinase/adenosylcobinamide-phosphate guanylyltransferase